MPGYHGRVTGTSIASRVGFLAVALSTALVIVAVAIVPFLNPVWVGFEQDRTGVTALTGYSDAEVRSVTNAILGDLVLGPPAFDVEINGQGVLTDAERSHMRDVRGVFAAFFALALVAAAIVGLAFLASRRDRPGLTRRAVWRAIRAGGLGLVAGMAGAGVIAIVAFDAAFEVFHELFFARGTYLFDPATSRLVQLFPDAFWSETAIAVGGISLVLALAAAWFAGRRTRGVGVGSREARAPGDGAEARLPQPAAGPGQAR
jgi:integral membrane protein (TIGR01906 family)